MNWIKYNDGEVLIYGDDIMKKTELNFEELQELVKTKDGIKKLIKLLARKIEESPEELFFPFSGLLNIIKHLEDDEIINTYIYHNDFIFKQIINNRNKYYDYVASIFPIIKSDDLKFNIFNKYKEIFVYEDPIDGKIPYDTKWLINTIFSFNSQEYINDTFCDETISTILKYEQINTQYEVMKEIAKKKTDSEKRKCIIPEVLMYISFHHRDKPILSIESDSVKKECMNDDRIKEILLNDKRYHTYAKVIASYKESDNIETALEEGINNNFFDGEDLAIMISAIKGDAKKKDYLNDGRIKDKFSLDDEAVIIKSYNEEDADQAKYDYINNKIINESEKLISIGLEHEYLISKYNYALKLIVGSMNDFMKNKCLNDERIIGLLNFSDICEIVKEYKDDSNKLAFIKDNKDKLAFNENQILKEIVLTMKTKYKKQCIEDDSIVAILKANKEKQQGGLTISNIVASKYTYNKKKDKQLSDEEIQKEQEEEDIFKSDFLRKEIQNLEEREIYSIINSINNPELKLDWVIECAKRNILDLRYIGNITKYIDIDEYIVTYDNHNGKPVSYKHR